MNCSLRLQWSLLSNFVHVFITRINHSLWIVIFKMRKNPLYQKFKKYYFLGNIIVWVTYILNYILSLILMSQLTTKLMNKFNSSTTTHFIPNNKTDHSYHNLHSTYQCTLSSYEKKTKKRYCSYMSVLEYLTPSLLN